MRRVIAPGAAFYSKGILTIYDLGVLGLSNWLVWRCPTARIRALYDTCVSTNHLDVGIGTGYYLDHCRFPEQSPLLTIVDLNANSLAMAERRLRRYGPRTILADVCYPLPVTSSQFTSVGCTYLLHCLPGSIDEKSRIIGQLADLVAPNGIFFGATILGQEDWHTLLDRAFGGFYNHYGVFNNQRDTLDGLRLSLGHHFEDVQINRFGSVALFTARKGLRSL